MDQRARQLQPERLPVSVWSAHRGLCWPVVRVVQGHARHVPATDWLQLSTGADTSGRRCQSHRPGFGHVQHQIIPRLQRGQFLLQSWPSEKLLFDCQKIAKNLTFFLMPKIYFFFKTMQLAIVLKKMKIFGNFFEKIVKYLAIFWQSNSNFPEGQMISNDQIRR